MVCSMREITMLDMFRCSLALFYKHYSATPRLFSVSVLASSGRQEKRMDNPCAAFSSPTTLARARYHQNVPRKRCNVCARSSPPTPALVFITPRGVCRDIDKAVRVAGAALSGGANLVQIRDIDATEEQLLHLSRKLVDEFKDARLFTMNGPLSLRVTQELPGFGIHLREKDRNTFLAHALAIAPDETYVGCSVHSTLSAKDAVRHGPISYLQVGTMFDTPSHPGKQPEGVGLMTEIRNCLNENYTLIGVGGIETSNVAQVIQSGANGVAVISGISDSPHPEKAAAEIAQVVKSAHT